MADTDTVNLEVDGVGTLTDRVLDSLAVDGDTGPDSLGDVTTPAAVSTDYILERLWLIHHR